jgi:transcriptional regulator with PAS, ATPase and Fis domain
MSRIGIIVPYSELLNEIKTITAGSQDILITLGTINHIIETAEELIKEGAEILVCRKGAANLLRKYFEFMPIVDIEISSYDIAEAVQIAKQYSKNIALILLKGTLYDEYRDLSPLFDCNIRIYCMEKQEQAEETIIQAMADGYEVILGGKLTCETCKQMGVQSVLIKSGRESIYRAIEQARSILKSKDDAVKWYKLIRDVIENTSVGIIVTNKEGVIKIANKSALKSLNKKREQVIGNTLINVFPEQITDEEGEIAIDSNGNNLILSKKLQNIESIDISSIITIEEISDINQKQTNIRNLYIKKGYKAKYSFADIKGNSRVIKDTINLAKRYASVDSTILIEGETGTGKEVFAQSIHNYSARKTGPFVAVNCAALTESLLESELFGYVWGAFTGASKNGKAGLFEIANGGTIFLDEIGEMSQTTQAKLLRVIQEREIIRLGDDRVIPVDVRIIAATNRDLQHLVDKGEFRPDLYYRISVLKLMVPPLRDRRKDIKILLEEFLNYYAEVLIRKKPKVCDECYDIIFKYKWPGNVRELRNFAERLMTAFDEEIILPEMLYKILDVKTAPIRHQPDIKNILDILQRNGFNKTKTAKDLGISRTTLWKLLKENDKLK